LFFHYGALVTLAKPGKAGFPALLAHISALLLDAFYEVQGKFSGETTTDCADYTNPGSGRHGDLANPKALAIPNFFGIYRAEDALQKLCRGGAAKRSLRRVRSPDPLQRLLRSE